MASIGFYCRHCDTYGFDHAEGCPAMTKSDTPRTNERICTDSQLGEIVPADFARTLERELTALRAEREWRLIESAPKDGTHVLISPCHLLRDKKTCEAYWHQPGNPSNPGYWMNSYGGPKYKPTHWQPLPPPPESKP